MRAPGLWLAGGLFYAAPIGAGLSGSSYFAVLPFAGLFFLWTIVMRYQPFKDGAAFVLPTLVVHFALASMCLGLGSLLRGLLQVETTTSLLPWLILGLGAVALGRLIWQPKEEAEVEALLETALKKLNEFADDAEEIIEQEPDLPLMHATPAEAGALAAAYGTLDAMPADGTSEADLRDLLMPLDSEIRAHILLEAFTHRAERTGTRRDRHAALVLASDGSLAWRQMGERRMALAFDLIVATADTVTLAHFLRLANAQLDDFPSTYIDMPDLARLLDISAQIEGEQAELAEGLVQLAHRIENLDRDQTADE